MATIVVVFKILFLVLIAHSFVALCISSPQHQAAGGESSAQTQSQIKYHRDNGPSTEATRLDGNKSSYPAQDLIGTKQSAPLVPEDHHLAANSSEGRRTTKPRAKIGAITPRSAPSPAAAAAANNAELCYLSNGGSSLTLTVNEATQVGSIIGTVDVNGDPSLESGNVNLFDALDSQQQQQVNRTGEQSGALGDLQSAPPIHSKSRRLLGRRSSGEQSDESDDSSVQIQLQHNRLPSHRSPARLLGLANEHHALPGPSAPLTSSAGSFYSLLAGGSAPVQPPVRLVPGTRNLVLARPLDKESAEGEQSLVINVRCSPRAPVAAEYTTIPVRLIVTDANDHAPEFVGAQPYAVNISETTPVGSVVSRDILAQDRDSAGPHSTLHYRVVDDGSPQATLLQFANPLDPTLVVAGQLDYESLASFTITIVAQDQAEPEPLSASTQVLINIIDFDDQNPRFLDDKYSLIMDDAQQNLVGQNLQVLPRNLYAKDGDRGIDAPIVYSFDQLGAQHHQPAAAAVVRTGNSDDSPASVAADEQLAANIERYLHLNPTSGEIRLIRQWPSGWLGSPVTLVVRATQADNKDRYTLTTLTISKPSARSSQTQAARARQHEDEKQVAAARSQGIEFTPDRLSIIVPENVPINEKIARVRARYSAGESASSQAQLADGQAQVDLVQEQGAAAHAANNSRAVRGGARPKEAGEVLVLQHNNAANKRPINYQILDDQTDQFGINGLGEIFVKRPLDYELRQEYKFRVLATYTKYSDICQVQVNVQNVNDNKPKFTQPQYNFHVTESRLRSNVIGTVQAHDADLNDTLSYSLLGDQAHLFEVSSGGQISLKPGTRQLNISACQLTVQAHDTLTNGGRSSPAQARVNIQVAPQLVGRSLSLESGNQVDKRQVVGAGSDRAWTTALPGGRRFAFKDDDEQLLLSPSSSAKDPSSSNQRSSVGTVVSSLQHMVRGSNLLDMPMSSALVLSAVLALLVCLLFIILISMSAHLYKRRAKARHRQHLAAAARLRQAQLAAAAAAYQPAGPAGPRYPRAGGPGASATVPTSSSASISSSPTNSTAAGGSPNYLGSPPTSHSQVKRATAAFARPSSAADSRPRATQKSLSRLDTISGRLSQQDHNRVLAISKQRSEEIEDSGRAKRDNGSGNTQTTTEFSLVSTLSSSQSKRSYQSNTTDDSSVMHCGHYSINTSCQLSPNEQTVPPDKQSAVSPVNDEATNKQQPLKVKQNAELGNLTNGRPGIKFYRKLPPLGSLARPLKSLSDQHYGADNCKDSAIGSDESPAANPRQGLMAMIRDPEQRKFASDLRKQQQTASPSNHQERPTLNSPPNQPAGIRWPQGLAPQRVKKLTWDDELSVANDPNDDCFVAPDLPQLGGPISPLGSQHHYPIDRLALVGKSDEIADGQFVEQQHFLFSNPCSPVPDSPASGTSSSGHHARPHNQGADYSSMLPPLVTEVGCYASGEQQHSSIMGQNNCFDYTIVQSSQFGLGQQQQQQQQSISSQHHLLQQQQLTKWPPTERTSYLYSNSNSGSNHNSLSNHQRQQQQHPDLRLVTAAAL